MAEAVNYPPVMQTAMCKRLITTFVLQIALQQKCIYQLNLKMNSWYYLTAFTL